MAGAACAQAMAKQVFIALCVVVSIVLLAVLVVYCIRTCAKTSNQAQPGLTRADRATMGAPSPPSTPCPCPSPTSTPTLLRPPLSAAPSRAPRRLEWAHRRLPISRHLRSKRRQQQRHAHAVGVKIRRSVQFRHSFFIGARKGRRQRSRLCRSLLYILVGKINQRNQREQSVLPAVLAPLCNSPFLPHAHSQGNRRSSTGSEG